MKLEKFKIIQDYIFDFYFEDGLHKSSNIEKLLNSKVSKEELKTAHLDKDWGCLEFKDGMVDINPKTLYNYVQVEGL